MLIDWFTVGAQVLNFLILVWLLKRFLYQPILHAIDEREKLIAAELADADAKKADAQKERDAFEHKNEEFNQERAALLRKATDEAMAERQRLLNETRQAAESLRDRLQETLRNEQRNLSAEIIRRTREEVFAIARKTLADLATTSLEEHVAAAFIRRLRELNGAEKDGLLSILKGASCSAVVRSAFALPVAQQSAITEAVKEVFATTTQVRFEIAPELVSGIEFIADGHKIAWSIAEYLTSLEKSVGELLAGKAERQ